MWQQIQKQEPVDKCVKSIQIFCVFILKKSQIWTLCIQAHLRVTYRIIKSQQSSANTLIKHHPLNNPFIIQLLLCMPVQRITTLNNNVYSRKKKSYSPNVGLEPTTLRLRVSCSTDWASRAVCEVLKLVFKNAYNDYGLRGCLVTPLMTMSAFMSVLLA